MTLKVQEVAKLLRAARKLIGEGESALREAAELLAEAESEGVTQRQMAASVGKSLGWVNALLSWRKRGYVETPFGPQSRSKRARSASVQAPELCSQDDHHQHDKRSDQDVKKEKPKGEPRYRWGRPPSLKQAHKNLQFSETVRARLVKLLGMLGSDHEGERANAARMADDHRQSMGRSWDDLISPVSDGDIWAD